MKKQIFRSNGRERGNVLLLCALCLVALFGAISLAVDIPRKQIDGQQLQAALDAGALAAAKSLDGSSAGLEAAGKAAQYAVAQNIPGFDTAKLQVSFGFYGAGDNENYSFEPIAGDEFGGLPAENVINAVRLESAVETSASFAHIFGYSSLGKSARRSTAVADINTEACVAPLAIPACQMFLNQDWEETALTTERFDPKKHLGREVVFMESSLWNSDVYRLRVSGYERYQWLERLPVVSFDKRSDDCNQDAGTRGENCRAETIQGVIALPGAAQAVTPEVLTNTFKELADSKKGCVRVKLGARVSPLETAPGIIRKPEELDDLERSVAKLINGPSREELRRELKLPAAGDPAVEAQIEEAYRERGVYTFKEAFTKKGGDVTKRREDAKDNYPFLRNDPEERIISWPIGTDVNGKLIYDHILMPKMGSWQWTNPLCHNELIPANQYEPTGPDKTVSRVREVTAMLIGPKPGVQYCNFMQQFKRNKPDKDNLATPADGDPSFEPPDALTEPRVIGFLKVLLIDNRFTPITQRENSEDPSPEGRAAKQTDKTK